MYVLSATPKSFGGICRTRIPIIDLEAIFLDQLKGFFANPERIAGYIRKANEAVAEKAQLLDANRAEIAKLETKTQRAYQLYLAAAIDSARFKELTAPNEECIRNLQDEAVRLQADLDLSRVNGLSTETVVSEALDLQKRWPSLETKERRRIVESIIESIVVDKEAGEIEITPSSIPTFEETTIPSRWCALYWVFVTELVAQIPTVQCIGSSKERSRRIRELSAKIFAKSESIWVSPRGYCRWRCKGLKARVCNCG